jgi:hypothetical protein
LRSSLHILDALTQKHFGMLFGRSGLESNFALLCWDGSLLRFGIGNIDLALQSFVLLGMALGINMTKNIVLRDG